MTTIQSEPAPPSVHSTQKLAGSRVLILGGSSGIGFAVAAAALDHGAHVIIASSQESKIKLAIERLKAINKSFASKIEGYQCNLSSAENMESNIISLFENATQSKAAPINHIVYTAGDAFSMAPIAEVTIPQIHASMTVRLIGPMMLAKHAAAYMNLASASSITFTSGTNVAKPSKGRSAMIGAVSGIEGFTRGLAVDLAPVRVNCVSPGAIRTELFNRFNQEQLDALMTRFANDTLLGEVGKPEDTAEAYVYFMKDRYATGVILETSGGRLLK